MIRRIKNNELAVIQGLLTIKMMAQALAVSRQRFNDYLKEGILPKPTVEVEYSSYKLYNNGELNNIKQLLRQWQTRVAINRSYHNTEAIQRKLQGLYSKVQAAKELEVPAITLNYWVKTKRIPNPSNLCGTMFCYNESDLTTIRYWMSKNYKKRQT